MSIDLSSLSDGELDQLRQDVGTEIERRRVLAEAPNRVEAIAEEVWRASGKEDGDKWVQPTGAHDAYPVGVVVTYAGKTWENITPANVWIPGESGWREITDKGSGAAPEWVQPSGAHDAYTVGDRVSFEGSVYESTINGNVWSPASNPQGWKVVAE